MQPITKEQYLATMSEPMKDVTQTAAPVVDIWPFVSKLADAGVVHKHVLKKHLVEAVYRSGNAKYDHVLLPTSKQNSFIAIIIDIEEKHITGYYPLDLNKEYGKLQP